MSITIEDGPPSRGYAVEANNIVDRDDAVRRAALRDEAAECRRRFVENHMATCPHPSHAHGPAVDERLDGTSAEYYGDEPLPLGLKVCVIGTLVLFGSALAWVALVIVRALVTP